MIHYRTFKNTDPPILATLWRSRTGEPRLWQPISIDLLEQLVFARLYFDYAGLVLAFDDKRPIGFAHASFGPNTEGDWISTSTGVICLILLAPDCPQPETAAGLLARCEEYLYQRGAKTLYGGGLYPLSPFYLGLYGGSESPGVLESDLAAKTAFESAGYEPTERLLLLRCDLDSFEPPIDRRQLQVRRQWVVEVTPDVPISTWWEACTLGEFELTRYELSPCYGGPSCAAATFRSLAPGGALGERRGMGLLNLHVEPRWRERGLALFLLSEAFRRFRHQGIKHVEAQIRENNAPVWAMFQKLGFKPTDRGVLWRKNV